MKIIKINPKPNIALVANNQLTNTYNGMIVNAERIPLTEPLSPVTTFSISKKFLFLAINKYRYKGFINIINILIIKQTLINNKNLTILC